MIARAVWADWAGMLPLPVKECKDIGKPPPQIYMSLADSFKVHLQVNYLELGAYFPITVI